MQRDYLELQHQALTDDQTVERSFLHVLDACEAVLASLYWLNHQEHTCEAFNIAHDHVTSIQSLLAQISTITQTQINTHDAMFAVDELAQLGADISKAEKTLNWKPKRTLQQMLEHQWQFYQNTLKM